MSDFKSASDVVVKPIDGETIYIKVGSQQYHVSAGCKYDQFDPDVDEDFDPEKLFSGIDIDVNEVRSSNGRLIESESERRMVADKLAEFYRNQGLKVEIS